MTVLTDLEERLVANARADLAKLSDEAKAAVIQAESWAHRNYWPSMLVALVIGAVLGVVV